MIILPAIDLKGGVCVRLRQGRADDVTTYNEDPAAQARDWRTQGGRELHVVDLDGAFMARPGTPPSSRLLSRRSAVLWKWVADCARPRRSRP